MHVYGARVILMRSISGYIVFKDGILPTPRHTAERGDCHPPFCKAPYLSLQKDSFKPCLDSQTALTIEQHNIQKIKLFLLSLELAPSPNLSPCKFKIDKASHLPHIEKENWDGGKERNHCGWVFG